MYKNEEFRNRFISDYKLPIPMSFDPFFRYHLSLYENEYGSLTKWNKLCEMVKNDFNYSVGLFLNEYYNVRDKIITTTENSEAYKDFNTCDMSKYEIGKMDVTTKNVYNNENLGKLLLTVDLKKANFQAIKYVNPEIVLNADTYEDFIGKFTNLQYVKESKYTRQIVFGKLNPKRHITVERYLLKKVLDYMMTELQFGKYGKLISFANDEMVFETHLPCECNIIKNHIKTALDIDVSVEQYTLKGLELTSTRTGNELNTIYYKEDYFNGKKEMKCCPITFHSIAYKLLHGMELDESDYYLKFDNILCKMHETFEHRFLDSPKRKNE